MMSTTEAEGRDSRWAAGLIGLGGIVLGVVALFAISILRDPGGTYDRWVPDEDPVGPEAAYAWVSEGLEVVFEDTSEVGDATIDRWEWDFGDGERSSEPAPTHRFGTAGEWDVTLDVVDRNGLSSSAVATLELEVESFNQGDGSIGLDDLADKVVATVERAAKGAFVVGLVVALLLVLSVVGGRLIRNGVHLMRPVPDRISVRLRPKRMELDLHELETMSHPPEPPASVSTPVATPSEERELVST